MLELIIFIRDIEFYSTSLATRHSSNKFGSALAARSVRAMLSTILPHQRPPADYIYTSTFRHSLYKYNSALDFRSSARKDRRPLLFYSAFWNVPSETETILPSVTTAYNRRFTLCWSALLMALPSIRLWPCATLSSSTAH